MPRYSNIVCAYCGLQCRKPSNPKYCSKNCQTAAFDHSIEEKIGKPIATVLYQLYYLDRLSYRAICDKLQINTRTLMRYMAQFGYKPREKSEAVKTQWENNPTRRSAQSKAFSKRVSNIRGARHHNWRGGSKYSNTSEWREIAEKTRERDKRVCQRCGMTENEHIQRFNSRLEVHHIIPYQLSQSNHLDNLRSLCLYCHHKTEHEFYWIL